MSVKLKAFTNEAFDNVHEINTDLTKKQQSIKQLTIIRPHHTQDNLNNELNYCKPHNKFGETFINELKEIRFTSILLNMFPIFKWLSQYSYKNDLLGDLISGCTVAVMHIPQGIGYALLGNVPPVVGIYMAFFPVLVYFILGTSRHNSMGTFAVVSIMVGKTVLTYSSPQTMGQNPLNETMVDEGVQLVGRSPAQVAAIVCFLVGIIQLIMYIFRLGVISFLLSDSLVSGFVSGAAIHVLTSQIKDLLGLTLPASNGYFKVINTYIDIFTLISKINWTAVIISITTIVILMFNNDYLKPKLAKRCLVPIPIELMAVLAGVLISRFLYLEDKFKIKTIGHIPTGFPDPQLPDFSLIRDILIDCFTIAMVSYTVSVSMALIFAQKLNYEIDFNQELLAMGAGNVFGSFFSCMPFSASLSRSSIQQTVGGKTQIASLISCLLLAIVLLWIGPFFELLPRCILSSIIVVALKGMLLQIKQFFTFLKYSRLDALVWGGTFLTVVIVAIDIGLLVGIILSISTIFYHGMKPYSCLIGNIPNTDLYLDVKRYKSAQELPNLKIFHYCGSLNFATKSSFKNELYEMVDINSSNKNQQGTDIHREFMLKCLIIDFSALTNIDPSGVQSLKGLVQDLNKRSVTVLIAGCSCPVFEVMKKCELLNMQNNHFHLFPTVHDAVHHCEVENITTLPSSV